MTGTASGPSRVAVRPVREDEWEGYRELRLRALETDPLAFGSTLARERSFPPETWKERIATGVRSTTWVAETPAGRFVGTTTAAVVEGAPHLFAMWVEREHRGMGVGRGLLDAALAWTDRSYPGRPVLLDVNPGQLAAVRLYESRGFRPTGGSSRLEHTPTERLIEMVRHSILRSSTGGAPG